MMNFPWLLQMAWRDSRKNMSRLLLFISSIIIGIAALVSIFSLGDTMSAEIDNQAASLIGADLEISTNKAVPEDIVKMIDSIPGEHSEQRAFTSMVYFPKSGGTRLIQVRALEGDFPYYGQLETTPVKAAVDFKAKKTVLVDRALLLQFNVRVGDSVRLGNAGYIIEGELSGVPGQTGLSASVAPIVFIPLETLPQTGLDQKGSRISTSYYIKTNTGKDVSKLMEKIGPRLKQAGINYETIESKKEETARSFRDLSRYLSLIGFIASAAWLYRCSQRHSYIYQGEDQQHCIAEMPGNHVTTGVHDLPDPDYCDWIYWIGAWCCVGNDGAAVAPAGDTGPASGEDQSGPFLEGDG